MRVKSTAAFSLTVELRIFEITVTCWLVVNTPILKNKSHFFHKMFCMRWDEVDFLDAFRKTATETLVSCHTSHTMEGDTGNFGIDPIPSKGRASIGDINVTILDKEIL